MKSVVHKIDTLRKAAAESVLIASQATLQKLLSNDLPKKDPLPIARAAGIQAAKKTSNLIPYCHPIPLDHVEIRFDVQGDRIRIEACVEAIWKTGLEMEALVAVSIAALTLYDMLKPVDPNMEILSTKLIQKKGGKSDYQELIPSDFQAAVMVTSDGTAQGKREDKSGKIIKAALEEFGIKPQYLILPDDKGTIIRTLQELCDKKFHLIVTTGGTGLGPRDVTVEATCEIMDREVPGIMEAARSFGQRRTPYAMLSRGVAAQKGGTLIVNLPGSSKGAQESLAAIFPAILHAYPMMEGGGHAPRA